MTKALRHRNREEKEKYKLYLICQTHWDREWRFPFQKARIMLVRMMDTLLDIMDNYPEYRYYHLDGQTILLEDYLEIRPGNRDRLKGYIKKGRILVGPWYTLPEENLITGESLVRNLLFGHIVGKEMGGVMKVGFTPASFGQIAQMPQVFSGFGIDTILFHRGVPAHKVNLEYLWRGPDGSCILGIRPSEGGRFNFCMPVFIDAAFGREEGVSITPYAEAPSQIAKDSFRLTEENSPESVYHSFSSNQRFYKKWIQTDLNNAIKMMAKEATTPCLLLGDGHDMSEPSLLTLKIINEANKFLGDGKLVLSSLPRYVAEVKRKIGNLTVIQGEMRSTQKNKQGAKLYPGILSSRMYLKQLNRKIEFLLTRWTEPISTFAWLLGKEYPQTLLNKTWKYLLANHTHDGLSGTGTDQVHEDMVYRFEQAELIAGNILADSFGRIIKRIDTSFLEENEISLVIFNPSLYPRTEVISLTLDLPGGSADDFIICDALNNPRPIQVVSKKNTISTIQRQPEGLAVRLHVLRVKLHLLTPAIPGLGYQVLKVRRPKTENLTKETRRATKNIAGEPSGREANLENESLKVTINPDGTLKTIDKTTGKVFDNLHYFEDGAEIGDAYEHKSPPADKIITSRNLRARINLEENGPLLARYRIVLDLKFPEAIDSKWSGRNRSEKTFSITSLVTLRKRAKRVEIVSKVDNNIKDHRLRVLFPVGIKAEFSCAETPFDIAKRPVKLPDTSGWIEPASPTYPQLNFVDINDGKTGMAIINEGLSEYEVVDVKNRIIALTLLRCFTYKVRSTQIEDPEQFGTQCFGTHEFKYAIYPHEGDWEKGEVFKEAYQHNLPLKTIQSGRRKGKLPSRMEFLQVRPSALILSAIKKTEERNSLILRLFNPTEDEIEASIKCFKKIKKAYLVNLNEQRQKEVKVIKTNHLKLVVKKKKVLSLELCC